MQNNLSRRDCLRMGLGATLTSAAGLYTWTGMRRAAAATTAADYKALVCVLLNGGNNGFNWIVPTSTAAYATYAQSRTTLALAQNTLLPLNGTASDGNTYGLHPSCPELQALFNQGDVAVVCNVGTLVQPTTAAQAIAGGVPLPPQLFSHADQLTEWMTAYPQSLERYGWAGRLADLFGSQGTAPNLAFNISIGGANYWQDGKTTIPYTLGINGAPTLEAATSSFFRGGLRAQATQALISQAAADPNPFVSQYAGIETNAAAKVVLVNAALSAAGDLATVFPAASPNDWSLAQQLHEVARVIKAYSQIGDSRQIFFVELGGFDTHNGELATQQQLLGYVSSYLSVFNTAMKEINMQNNVTTFTMSDFGRTLSSNGNGSDHGWGNHQIVMGGAVKGGTYYGTMPSLVLGGADDFGSGRLVPTTSCDQFAATLARWFGVSTTQLPALFPNVANFASQWLSLLG
jgi:uncharacterized protein (DUF1501 family)